MKAGQVLLVLLLLIGSAGVLITGSSMYSHFLYLGSLLSITSWVWMRWSARGLQIHRHARVQRANVGDIFEEKFEVANTSRVSAPWIEVLNKSTIPFAAGSRLFTLVKGREKQSYIARTWLTRRGAFPLGPTRISTGDPFGFFSSGRDFPPTQTLLVLPVIFEIKSFLFPAGLLPGGQVIRRKSADINPHASGIREYVHGDAMKRIHWATSVRRNQLMVKEFEQDPQAEIWLYLDLQGSVHYSKPHEIEEMPVEALMFRRRPKFKLPPSTLEYSVSITASLAHYYIGKRRAVGFVSAGQTFTVHPAEHSDRQAARILETLAFVEANGELSMAGLVTVQSSQLPQGSSVILVTPTMSPDLLHAVDDLQRRFLRPVVILLDSATFGGVRGTDKLVLSLRERRVPVVVIKRDDDLTGVLSILPTTYNSQEMRPWQNPISSR